MVCGPEWAVARPLRPRKVAERSSTLVPTPPCDGLADDPPWPILILAMVDGLGLGLGL
jgi:hypothetical protein